MATMEHCLSHSVQQSWVGQLGWGGHRGQGPGCQHMGLESHLDFLEGFQQAQTVTRVTRRKMPPVDRMM